MGEGGTGDDTITVSCEAIGDGQAGDELLIGEIGVDTQVLLSGGTLTGSDGADTFTILAESGRAFDNLNIATIENVEFQETAAGDTNTFFQSVASDGLATNHGLRLIGVVGVTELDVTMLTI